MAGLKIALVNGIKPIAGSGDGITEYAYNMYLQLGKRNEVIPVYSISASRKNDVHGLLKVNSYLSRKVRSAVEKKPDILHIVNQEVGFAAKDSKTTDSGLPVATTIHDISRFEVGLHRGVLQKAYNIMVQRSIMQSIRNSDLLLFDSSQTMAETRRRFDIGRHAVVNIGIGKKFSAPKRTKRSDRFTVGYIGSFAYHKNVIMLLRAARELGDAGIMFSVYGIGNEASSLAEYRERNGMRWVGLNGFAAESRKVAIYDTFDVFAFPSLYEGFGLPILEAMARGLPVVIYKKGKIPKEVRKYCIEAADESHMAQIISELRERGYGAKRRAEAMAYARGFTWERCAEETLKAYGGILGR